MNNRTHEAIVCLELAADTLRKVRDLTDVYDTVEGAKSTLDNFLAYYLEDNRSDTILLTPAKR